MADIRHLTDQEKELVMSMREDGKSIQQIMFELGRSEGAIRDVIAKYDPTTKLASRYIKANAHKLAERIVEKADVSQAIDILSRPNIGVLDPISQGDRGPQMFMSVSMGSLGGVIDATRAGRQISDGPAWGQAGISGKPSSGSQEHVYGGDTYPGGVRGRPELTEATQGRESDGQGEPATPQHAGTLPRGAREEAGGLRTTVAGAEQAVEQPESRLDRGLSARGLQENSGEGPQVPRGKRHVADGGHGTQRPARNDARKGRNASLKPRLVDPNPVREAIPNNHHNPRAHGKSSIHLRYDIADPPEEGD